MRRVSVIRETPLEFPQLYMDVFIAGDEVERRAFAEMFIRSSSRMTLDPLLADLVVFTGGEDVNPVLYGETKHSKTFYDDDRDKSDIALYQLCYKHGIPMFGVCRGAQFLHVMNGGKLYQDVDGHVGAHKIYDRMRCVQIPNASSVHHQLCIDNKDGGMELIADAYRQSNSRWFNASEVDCKVNAFDVEAFFYRETGCFGVQGHPEYKGYAHYTKWCLEYIEHLFYENPDFKLTNKVTRMLPELIAQREQERADKKANKTKEMN